MSIGAQFAINQWVAVGVFVHLEFAPLIIMQELLLNLCHFETQWELLVKSRPQELDPLLEPNCVRKLGQVLLLEEGEPVHLADPVIVFVLTIWHGFTCVALDK